MPKTGYELVLMSTNELQQQKSGTDRRHFTFKLRLKTKLSLVASPQTPEALPLSLSLCTIQLPRDKCTTDHRHRPRSPQTDHGPHRPQTGDDRPRYRRGPLTTAGRRLTRGPRPSCPAFLSQRGLPSGYHHISAVPPSSIPRIYPTHSHRDMVPQQQHHTTHNTHEGRAQYSRCGGTTNQLLKCKRANYIILSRYEKGIQCSLAASTFRGSSPTISY